MTQEQEPKVTWRGYDSYRSKLPNEVITQGLESGQWPEETPEWFINLEARLTDEEKNFRHQTAEEKLLSAMFGEHSPRIKDVLARPPDYVARLAEEKRQREEGMQDHTRLKDQMEEVLSSLTGRERFVLKSRFGLEDGRSRTLKAVGVELGMEVRGKAYSEGRIRQIEAKALRKLRHPSSPHKA